MSTAVIIGATGAQGGGVARGVVANETFDVVKLATRNVASESATNAIASMPSSKSKIESVALDLSDKASVEAAFAGADAVFATFNYWGTFASVGYDEEKTIETEYQQGKNVVDAAKAAGVKHVVLSTLEDVETISGGKIASWHFTTKGRIEKYAIEQGIPFTFVRYAFYFQNFGSSFIPPDEEGYVIMPMKDHVLDAIDVEDAGKAIAVIFKEGPEVWAGKEIGIASDSMTVDEYMSIYTEVKADGKTYKYKAVPWEEMAKMPGAKDLAEMFCFYTDYDTQCIRNVEATKKLYPRIRNFRQYAEAAKAAGKF